MAAIKAENPDRQIEVHAVAAQKEELENALDDTTEELGTLQGRFDMHDTRAEDLGRFLETTGNEVLEIKADNERLHTANTHMTRDVASPGWESLCKVSGYLRRSERQRCHHRFSAC